ncbi:MAG: cytochrome c [Balneolaceae bacterium]|nr:cytochrome c [Balneolaceae bacterium]
MAFTLLAGCGGGNSESPEAADNGESNSGLTEFQMKHGIGPVTEAVSLGAEVNSSLVEEGEKVFKTKCSACHKMEQDYVGPPLGDVLEKRTPTYVMNMILNPVEMTKKHPDAREMLGQYMNQMTFQNVTKEQARSIVEYLRTQDDESEQ